MITQQFRPTKFSEVAGQELNKRILKAIVKSPDSSPKSLILAGSFGTGKTTTARIFARALNCLNKSSKNNGDPCGICENCREDINNAGFYDEYDAAIVGSVEKIRELREHFYWSFNGYKVVVFDEAHLASSSAQSALLKVIEEIKGNVFFIFATTHPDNLLPTIRSRSLELRYTNVDEQSIILNLRAICGKLDLIVSDEILVRIARRSKGHMRNAHMLLDKFILLGEEDFLASVRSSRDEFLRYFVEVLKKNKEGVIASVNTLSTFPLADLKTDYQSVVLEISRASIDYPEVSDPVLNAIVKALGNQSIKFIRELLADWVLNSFESDLTLQACLLSFFQYITGYGNSQQVSSTTQNQQVRGANIR